MSTWDENIELLFTLGVFCKKHCAPVDKRGALAEGQTLTAIAVRSSDVRGEGSLLAARVLELEACGSRLSQQLQTLGD